LAACFGFASSGFAQGNLTRGFFFFFLGSAAAMRSPVVPVRENRRWREDSFVHAAVWADLAIATAIGLVLTAAGWTTQHGVLAILGSVVLAVVVLVEGWIAWYTYRRVKADRAGTRFEPQDGLSRALISAGFSNGAVSAPSSANGD
jgi:hypothetical protein